MIEPGRGLAARQPLPCVAVCGLGSPEDDSAAAELYQRLQVAEPLWLDLSTVAQQSFEELDQSMARRRRGMVLKSS